MIATNPPYAIAPGTEDCYDTFFIEHLFDNLSNTYDPINSIATLGLDSLVRRYLLKHITTIITPCRVADLMCGHGETWPQLIARFPQATIDGYDCSAQMLQLAALSNKTSQNPINLHHTDILKTSLPSERYDIIVCAFGLKMLSNDQYPIFAQQVKTMLKPGGQFTFIEITKPANKLLATLLGLHLGKVVPFIGRTLGRSNDYNMLWEYTQRYDGATLAATAFNSAGLHTTRQSHLSGCITGIYGYKK